MKVTIYRIFADIVEIDDPVVQAAIDSFGFDSTGLTEAVFSHLEAMHAIPAGVGLELPEERDASPHAGSL